MARRNRKSTPAETVQKSMMDLRGDYSAARASRFRRVRTGVSSSGSHADFHYRNEADYLRMMEYARDMDRNDAIVGQAVDRAVTNAVKGGLKPDPDTGNDELDATIIQKWTDWAEDADQCDVTGERTFNEIQKQALRQMMVDGDLFALPIDSGALQLVEAHRCRTPRNTKRNIVHGVVLNNRRRRMEYWFTKEDLDPRRALNKVNDVTKVAARDENDHRQVFHIYNPKRVSQTRGVTAFAPVFDVAGMTDDLNFAKLVQAQIVSCFAIFRQREMGGDYGDIAAGERSTETLADGTTRTIEGIQPGMDIAAAPGERIEGFSPNTPNAEFFPHMRLLLTLIGVNLGLPLIMILMDGSETNFSGWRGAVDMAREGFRDNQRILIDRLCRPAYVWKLRHWMSTDSAFRKLAQPFTDTLHRHKWNRPTWPYIEPLKDATADLVRVRNGLISPRRLHAERGQDWADIYRETVADNQAAIEEAMHAAATINQAQHATGFTVHWRELLSLPAPDGMKINLNPTMDTTDENDAPE